jgi:hypothetical protein
MRLGLAVVLSGILASCSRPGVAKNQPTEGGAQADQGLAPFRDRGEVSSSDSTSRTPFQAEATGPTKAGVPFPAHLPATLPAGTLLTVRIESPIVTDRNARGTFAAVLDEPVIVNGNVLVPRGAAVAGRLEAARSSTIRGTRCCICLTLDSIGISGKELPIQTSSLFTRTNGADGHDSSRNSSTQAVRLKTGRRLTFRLAEATYIASQEAVSH